MSMFVINRHGNSNNNSQRQEKKDKLLEKLKGDAVKRASELAKNEFGCDSTSSPPKVTKLDDTALQHFRPEKSEAASETSNCIEYDPFTKFKFGIKKGRETMQTIGYDFEKEEVVFSKLPEWLEHPYCIPKDLGTESKGFVLDCIDDILKTNLMNMGITTLFPVQLCLIPVISLDSTFGLGRTVQRPNDICVCSPTGSGKTLAYAIPILNEILKCNVTATRAIVLLPTIELAKQVYEVFVDLCTGSRIMSVLLGGSKQTAENKLLFRETKFGVRILPDVIVATPGRLVECLEMTDSLDLSYLRFLVIDEADRMLDFVKQSWLQRLEERLSEQKLTKKKQTLEDFYRPVIPVQKLLFSATMTTDPEKLKEMSLFQPRLFTSVVKSNSSLSSIVPKYITPSGLKEYRIDCSRSQRPLLLINLIHKLKIRRALCFTCKAETSHRVSTLLQHYFNMKPKENNHFVCMEFSSKLTKKKRKRTLADFRSGKINLLVSSDSTARGIDIEDVEQVILYETPRFMETYIHRVGRTSRAGKEGAAYSFFLSEEISQLKEMFKDAGRELPQSMNMDTSQLDNLNCDYQKALGRYQHLIESERRK